MAALVLRIKFPPTYPLIYKTLRIDANLTVTEAITFIGESLNVACGGNIGLFLPDEKRWLDPDTKLSLYENLQEEVSEFPLTTKEYIEYKDKFAKGGGDKKKKDEGGCCTIL